MEEKRLGQRGQHAAGDLLGLGGMAGVFDQRGELVTAEPGGGVM